MSTIVKDLVSYLQCGETIAIRDAIRIDSATGKIFKFDATNDAHVFAGLAKEGGVLNDYIRVVQSGRIKGFTGLTSGAFVYASVTTPGGFQLAEPASSQKIVLGIATTSTELNINGALGIKPGGDGGAGGGLDAYYTENMEGLANTSTFATGNNAVFLGGGTLQGTLALETVSPISDLKSLKYTQAAGSLNDYFASPLIAIDSKQKNNDSGMTLYFTYNGNDNDMRFVVWDVTNNQRLSSEVAFVKLTGKATRYSLSFYVPTTCTQIRWGAQVLVVNSGKILVVDDVELSSDPFHEGELLTQRTTVYAAGNAGQAITVGVTDIPFIEIEDVLNAWNGTQFIVPDDGDYQLSGVIFFSGADALRGVELYIGGVQNRRVGERLTSNTHHFQYEGRFTRGQVVSLRMATNGGTLTNSTVFHHLSIQRIPESTSHILTPVDTFSTDTAPLTYAGSATYTLATLANAPVGTYITFTYAINSNTRTQTASPNRPTQTDADMNVNGMQIFTRAYNAASTAASPAAIAIQIGKGLKGTSLGLYKSAGKVVSGALDWQTNPGGLTNEYGLYINSYDEKTGVLVVDAGVNVSTSNNAHNFVFSDISTQTNGYLTINASKSPALTAVPTPLVAYLKDVKASGTNGGTFTSGAWQTRTLNTVEGDTSFVSLSANQVVIPAGSYEIEATAPAYLVNSHQLKLRNITDSTDAILGNSSASAPTNGDATLSRVVGTVNLTSSKTFELQHRCATTAAANGFGPSANFGVSEVYAQLKITKRG